MLILNHLAARQPVETVAHVTGGKVLPKTLPSDQPIDEAQIKSNAIRRARR